MKPLEFEHSLVSKSKQYKCLSSSCVYSHLFPIAEHKLFRHERYSEGHSEHIGLFISAFLYGCSMDIYYTEGAG